MNRRLAAVPACRVRVFRRFVFSSLLVMSAAHATDLRGAGATFPEPLYLQLFTHFKIATKNTVTYDGVGSGKGQSLLIEQKVDFGASDVPMSDETLRKAPARVLHVPTGLGAVVPIYNIGKLPAPLKFSGGLLADIFLGKVKTWNDPAIARLNPGVELPKYPITVVHRSESSGTTYVLTDFFSKTSTEWANKIGASGKPVWPIGRAIEGNDGVLEAVEKTFGAIGYTELANAVHGKVMYGLVQNQAGNFVKPDVASVMAAAESVDPDPETRYSITNAPGANSYPISTFTYVMVYREQSYNGRSRVTAQALKDLLTWVITDGQKYHRVMDYTPLPKRVVDQAQAVLSTMTFSGAKLR